MTVPAIEGYRLWAAHYDEMPNPLLALESRLLAGRLGPLQGLRFLDAGCGTGRWISRAAAQGAKVVGIDFCIPMLERAVAKPGLGGHCAAADLSRIPARDGQFDLTVCSFTLSYLPRLQLAIAELARVSGNVIVSDLHPEAMRRGWTRSFRANDQVVEINDFPYTLDQLDRAARSAGLVFNWRVEASFGEPERKIFSDAGKDAAYVAASSCPAVLITSWTK